MCMLFYAVEIFSALTCVCCYAVEIFSDILIVLKNRRIERERKVI